MSKKFLAFSLVISLVATCMGAEPSPAPGESPAASASPAKHRSRKKADAAQTASPAESPAAAASPAKHKSKKKEKAEAAASPAAAESPAAAASPKKSKKKAEATTSTSPAAEATASASPAEKKGHKKAKSEAAASPAASATPGKFLGIFSKPKPSTTAAATPATEPAVVRTAPEPGGGHGLVWVNTDTHVYHKEGSRFYGRTKKGKYMTEAEAVKEGAKASKEAMKGVKKAE